MCDYSLMAVPNRLAREGEELVVHRFPTGSLGLASPPDVARATTVKTGPPRSFWRAFWEFFDPPTMEPVAAVCIPPGARLRLENLPARLQRDCGVAPVEEVTFTQLTEAVNTYRDAVRFSNGRQVRLQELREGLIVFVLDLSGAGELSPERLEWPEMAHHR